MNVIVFHPDDELCRMLESEMVRQPDVTVLPASYEELADSGLRDGAAVVVPGNGFGNAGRRGADPAGQERACSLCADDAGADGHYRHGQCVPRSACCGANGEEQ